MSVAYLADGCSLPREVIWIPARRDLDPRDYHTDSLARFVKPGVIVLSKANEVKPTEWTAVHEKTLETLSFATESKVRWFGIIEIEESGEEFFELPPTVIGGSKGVGDYRVVRNYVNFLLVNYGVIMPQFGDPDRDFTAIQ